LNPTHPLEIEGSWNNRGETSKFKLNKPLLLTEVVGSTRIILADTLLCLKISDV
jgi:hypothetical protein